MITKALIVLIAAVVVTASLMSVADAQRARGQQQAVQPFTNAERNWFAVPEGRERLPY